MKKRLSVVIALIFIVVCLSSCIPYVEKERNEYGVLMSAVAFSAEKMIGAYGENIPNDFSEMDFVSFIKKRIPEDYYDVIRKYLLKIEPKGSYYLLLVLDPENKSIILFDYSCTTSKIDGPVFLDPIKYDVNKIDIFDKCKP